LLDLETLHTTPRPDPISTIVYAAEAGNVDTVIIDGIVVMREGKLTTLDEKRVIEAASEQSRLLSESLEKR